LGHYVYEACGGETPNTRRSTLQIPNLHCWVKAFLRALPSQVHEARTAALCFAQQAVSERLTPKLLQPYAARLSIPASGGNTELNGHQGLGKHTLIFSHANVDVNSKQSSILIVYPSYVGICCGS